MSGADGGACAGAAEPGEGGSALEECRLQVAAATGALRGGVPDSVFGMLRWRTRTLRGPQRFDQPLAAKAQDLLLPEREHGRLSYVARAFCGRFSPDGEFFCAASQNALIHVYDTNKWRRVARIAARDVGWSVLDIDHSPDMRFVAYSSWSDSLHLCNVRGDFQLHEELRLMSSTERRGVFSVRFSPSSANLAAACNEGLLCLMDVERRRPICLVQAHADDVNTVSYVDGSDNLVVTGSDDFTLRVWDKRQLPARRGAEAPCAGGFVGHRLGLTSVVSRGDGRLLLSNGKDHCLKLWDMRRMSSAKRVDELVSGAEFQAARRFDYRFHRAPSSLSRHAADQSLQTYRGHSVASTLIRCDFSPLQSTGGKYVYCGSAEGLVYVYDLVSGEVVRRLGTTGGYLGNNICRDVSWHPHLPIISGARWDGTVRLYSRPMGAAEQGDPPPSLLANGVGGGDQDGDDANDDDEDDDGGGGDDDNDQVDEADDPDDLDDGADDDGADGDGSDGGPGGADAPGRRGGGYHRAALARGGDEDDEDDDESYLPSDDGESDNSARESQRRRAAARQARAAESAAIKSPAAAAAAALVGVQLLAGLKRKRA